MLARKRSILARVGVESPLATLIKLASTVRRHLAGIPNPPVQRPLEGLHSRIPASSGIAASDSTHSAPRSISPRIPRVVGGADSIALSGHHTNAAKQRFFSATPYFNCTRASSVRPRTLSLT
jgi:hypothetical protein